MVEVAKAAGDAERMIDAQLMLFIAYTELGRMAEARRKLQDVIRIAQDVRGLTPWQLWLGMARYRRSLSWRRLCAGIGAAEREAALATPPPLGTMFRRRLQAFLLAREQGTLAGSSGTSRLGRRIPWYPCHRAALALLLLDLGREQRRAPCLQIWPRTSCCAVPRQ